jgi:hypothetical protein
MQLIGAMYHNAAWSSLEVFAATNLKLGGTR